VFVPAVVAVVALGLGGALAWASRDDGGAEPLPALPTTTVDAGGIEVDAPEGWSAIPVPQMGFGLAIPPGWEATLTNPEVLAGIDRSSPAVPGFLDAAHAAAENGAVFYGAGVDDDDHVTDLKVRASTDAGVDDVAGLTAYAERLAADAGLSDTTVEAVEGADRPTVRMSFTSTGKDQDGKDVPVTGSETLVLGPRDVVWSVIVTSEVPDVAADLAPQVTRSFTLADAPAATPTTAPATTTTAAPPAG
jgi:hypothetical protein